ncbi:hypothetical protein MRB53_039096 [Persea americana]|nr:hypothetical protein MRB53_039096 [Persea americana]
MGWDDSWDPSDMIQADTRWNVFFVMVVVVGEQGGFELQLRRRERALVQALGLCQALGGLELDTGEQGLAGGNVVDQADDLAGSPDL